MNLKEILHNSLTEQELQLLVKSFDLVGDIALTIIPPQLEPKEQLIAQGIMALNKNIRVVAKRDGTYGGEFRILPLKIIGGEQRTTTIHREHGVRFALDLQQVYFSVRSSHERQRIAALVQPDEQVLIMFSGIGPLPLIIARHSQARHIVGIEKNPLAHDYARQSLAMNKKIENVTFFNGDVTDIIPSLPHRFDRVAMVLPASGKNYIEHALSTLRPGGYLHFYDFQSHESLEASVDTVRTACLAQGRSLIDSHVVLCGHTSPSVYRICVDCMIG